MKELGTDRSVHGHSPGLENRSTGRDREVCPQFFHAHLRPPALIKRRLGGNYPLATRANGERIELSETAAFLLRRLAADAETRNQSLVALRAAAAQIIQQTAAACHHL